jgi:predicted MPP superfamily phosphohydrolase
LLALLRKLFFWNYARNTWQWDALCVVILIFIFLTPKGWYESSELKDKLTHQTPAVMILLNSCEVIENTQDNAKLEQCLREQTGRQNLRILNVKRLTDGSGKIKGYEVDIE